MEKTPLCGLLPLEKSVCRSNNLNVGADGDTHFLFELPGEVIFGVAHMLCQMVKPQLLLRMKLDIIPARTNLGGNLRIGTVLPYTEDKIFVHGKGQRCQIGKGFALGHAVDISATNGIGGICGDSSLNGFPNAEGCESGGCDDGILQRFLMWGIHGIEQMIRMHNCLLIADIAFPY